MHAPWPASQTSLSAQQGRSIPCMHCRSPSDIQRAQSAQLVRPLLDACRMWTQQDKLTHTHTHTNRNVHALAHHLARGLMIWGWSQMNVGLTQSTSTKSPTSCICGGHTLRPKKVGGQRGGCHQHGLVVHGTSVHPPCLATVWMCVVEDTQCCSSHKDHQQTDEILE